MGALERALLAERPDQALIALEKQSLWPRDRLLYLLDKGMLLRVAGDYAGSAGAFEEAKRVMERLDALSMREQASALSINDTLRSYAGERYERVLLHVYAALNYLESGQPEQARVEALQLDTLLKDDKGFGEEAFARYLSGLIFEQLGELSDALIAYRKAYEAYNRQQSRTAIAVPLSLQRDLLRLTARQGLWDEHRQLQESFGFAEAPSDAADQGELIVLVHTGLHPRKQEHAVEAVHPSGRLLRLAVPYYESRRPVVSGARLVAGERAAEAAVVEEVGRIAEVALDQQLPAITARALARVVVKDSASRNAGNRDQALGLLTNIATFVTERADTRAWYTLPQQILLARLALPPGRYPVRLELYGEARSLNKIKDYSDVVITAGQRRFISLHMAGYRAEPARSSQ